MDAEGDENKRRSNIAKHSIDFACAVSIFDGAFVELSQRQREYGEERIGALGRLEEEVIFVVFTWRGERRRIISARRARRDERKRYYKGLIERSP